MVSGSPPPLSWLALLLAVVVDITGASAAIVNGSNSIPDPKLMQLFPQLSDVNTPLSWAPSLGGQNFTTCCLKAFNEALTVTANGSLAFADESYSAWITFNNSTTPLNALKDYNIQGQFPCTAVYNGNADGAPMLTVPYQWLNDTCPGWQISSKDNLNAWLQPLSGFLIPAIVFCISVPRRRKLELPKVLFSSDQSGVQGYFLMLFGAPVALALVAVDTLVWLCICFAFSGPMIISGLYEAVLDNRIIEFVKGKINEKQLTLDMRCRCLMLVLIGNLDLEWSTENGGHVDGGSPAVADINDQAAQGLLSPDGQDQNMDNFHDDQHNSGYAMDTFTAPGAYGQVAQGPPSAASVSPGSPTPAVPHSPIDTAYNTPPQPPIQPVSGDPHNLQGPAWSHSGAGPGQGSPGRTVAFTENTPAGHSAVYGQARLSVPALSFQGAPAEPLDHHQAPPMAGNVDGLHVNGFPPNIPGPSHSVLPQTPPRQHYGLPSQAPASGHSAIALAISSANAAATSIVPVANQDRVASPWKHMEQFLYGLRLYPDENKSRGHSPRQNRNRCEGCDACVNEAVNDPATCTNLDKELEYRTRETVHLIHQIKTRLKTMLHCQYSFGSVIGAPVIFFLGGFIFALLQSLDTLGDEDIAEGLAFGQWYMTIPHIAIISGLLLAGNNPNILEGVLAVDGPVEGQQYYPDEHKILFFNYGLAYPSCYKVASLWDRGHNKKMWIETLIKTYLRNEAAVVDKDIQDLRSRTTLPFINWIFLLFLAFLLLGVPFVLAFLTAFYTPEIGLSCRSLTFSIYFCVQTMQIVLWMWAYAGPLPRLESRNNQTKWFGIGGRLDSCGFYKPYSLHWLYQGERVPRSPSKIIKHIYENPDRLLSWGFLWNLIYYPSEYFLGLVGIMAAIGGTLMQLMGVYTADICYVTTKYWFLPMSERGPALLSSNSAEMIKNAELFWKPCAIAGIAFMSVVSFIGWWYQRRMRDIFAEQVLRIDKEDLEREKDSIISRRRGAQRSSAVVGGRHVSSAASFYNPPPHDVRQFSTSSNPEASAAGPATAARGYSMPNASYYDNGGLRHASGSSVSGAIDLQPRTGDRHHRLVRSQYSMPVIPSVRQSFSSSAYTGVPNTEPAPATVPLQSVVWNSGVPSSPPRVGQRVMESPEMMSTPGPANSRVFNPTIHFTDPHGGGGEMSGSGLGLYARLDGHDPESEGVNYHLRQQSVSPDNSLV